MKEIIGKADNLFSRFCIWWKDYFHVLVTSFIRLSRDNVSLMASGMVYSTLVAIIPGFTFLFAFFSAFGMLESFLSILSDFFVSTMGEENAASLLTFFSSFEGRAVSLGVAGFVSFIFTSVFLINKIYTLMNQIYRTRPQVGTLRRLMTFLTVLVVAAFLVIILMGITSRISVLLKFIVSDGNATASFSVLSALVMFGLVWLVLFFLLFFVPNVKVRKRSASVGATTGCVSIYIATMIFNSIMTTSVSYSLLYGSLASLFVFLLYLYIVWYILMVSAEVTYVHQFRPETGQAKGRPESPMNQMTEGVNLLILISDKYKKGEGAMGEKELTRKLGIPNNRLYGFLNCFEDGGLILATNTQRSSFVPARPLDQIYLIDVVRLLYGNDKDEDHTVVTMGEAVALELEEKGLRGLENVSIENIMERL